MIIALALAAVFIGLPLFIGACIAAGSSPSVFPILPEPSKPEDDAK